MLRRTLRVVLVVTPLTVLALLPAAAHPSTAGAATAPTASVVGPKAYYLALGDSLAYGYQPNGDFTHGYADDFFTDLQTHGTQSLIDMGCPGETSVTFIKGGCPSTDPPKYPYTGPQLAAALSFIKQHPGQVSPVTLDIGANDLFPQVNPLRCSLISSTVFLKTLVTFSVNLNVILAQLKTALHGTGDLAVMTYYFPLQNLCPRLMPLVQLVDGLIAKTAATYGASVADVFTAFGGSTVPNPNLCTYTWICSPFLDIHATDLGYSVIAQTYEKTLGY